MAHGNIEANRCMSSRLIVRGGTPRSRGDGTVSDVDGEVAAEKEKKKKKKKKKKISKILKKEAIIVEIHTLAYVWSYQFPETQPGKRGVPLKTHPRGYRGANNHTFWSRWRRSLK